MSSNSPTDAAPNGDGRLRISRIAPAAPRPNPAMFDACIQAPSALFSRGSVTLDSQPPTAAWLR
jgi:hypothetical protein